MANIYGVVKGFTGGLLAKGQGVLDSLFPPEKRAELLTKLQMFAVNNPKLSVSPSIKPCFGITPYTHISRRPFSFPTLP